MNIPKAVIFDMDGLMVDSEPLHFDTQDEVLKRRGKRFNLETKRQTLGRSLRDTVTLVKNEFGLQDSVDELMSARQNIFLELAREKLELRLGLLELVQKLHQAGIKMAVASSQQPEYVNWVVDHFNLRKYFPVVLSAQDVNDHAKPDPKIFLLAAEKLGVKPEGCVVLEDTVNGILAAKAAGMKGVAVYDSHFSKPEDFPMADLILTNLQDVTLV